MSRWLLLLVCFSLCVHVHAATTDGQKDFASAGWPAMVMLFGPGLLIYTIASGVIQHGFLNLLQHKLFLLFHLILLFCAIILSFGPGGIPPTNILGLQLWFLIFIGIHLMFHSNVYVKWSYFVVGVFTLLGLTGSLATLGYALPIFRVDHNDCLNYFVQQTDDSYQRCDDKGFLQLIRTCGTASIFILFATISHVFLDLTNNISSTTSSNQPSKQDVHEPLMNDEQAHQGSYQTTGGDQTPPNAANREYSAL